MPTPMFTLTGQAAAEFAGETIWLRAIAEMITVDDVQIPVETHVITLDDTGAVPAGTTIVPSTANDGGAIPYIVQQQYGDWKTGYVTIDTDPFDLITADYVGATPPVSPGVPPASEQALQAEIQDRIDGDTLNADATAAVAADLAELEDDLAATNAAVSTLQTGLSTETSQRIDAGTALASSAADNAAAIAAETARAQGVEAAKADLVGGKVPTSQLPAVSLFHVVEVANQAARLALTAGESYLAKQTDTGAWWAIDSSKNPAILGNWVPVNVDPSAAVNKVNNQVGDVVLGYADVGADPAGAATAAQAAAIAASAADATTKAAAAQSAATTAAAADATTKAAAAQSAAIATASGDATTKANAAQAAAIAASQPLDADLTAIAALDSTVAGVMATDGTGWFRKGYAAFKAALGITAADVSGLGSIATHPTTDFQAILSDPGTPWSTGAASIAGRMWTYSGGRYCDVQGGNLPAAPSTPRFIFTGLDTSALSSAEIDFAENVSGSPTTATANSGVAGAAVTIPTTAISVPAQSGAVWLRGESNLQQITGAATGKAQINLIETTGGGSTLIAVSSAPLPNTISNNGNGLTIRVMLRLPSVASTRTFNLQLQVVSISGAVTVKALNLSGAGSYLGAYKTAA